VIAKLLAADKLEEEPLAGDWRGDVVGVQVRARQLDDGRIESAWAVVQRRPGVKWPGSLNAVQCRDLGRYLLAAADELEELNP
jgi:hypothetical protein